ncbi:MAG: putative chitinase [Blastocatellia bacterium]|jgi:putative chitinase|nr:putative chitinase [Blastocatellia bacterium]
MSVLKQGSSGPDVKDLQQKLKDLGFDPNGVDGHFGPGTTKAVTAFQQSKGLQADGVAGPATLAALQGDGAGDAGAGDGSAGGDAAGATANAGGLNLDGLAGKVPAGVIAQIPETAQDFGITTNLRLAHFLAQCALESNNFTATVENLNYRAARLMEVFPRFFRGVDPAAFANSPEKIGNRVYANRMGNGDEASGDGFKFRGRGYIQLTGRNNYTSFSTFVGEDCVANPDLVATKFPLASAAFYFKSNNIWAICDRGADDGTVTQVTKAVNGGTHGLAERLQNFKKFMQAL